MARSRPLCFPCLLMLALAGCASPGSSPAPVLDVDGGAPVDGAVEDDLETTQEALVTGEYTWSQGQGQVPMLHTSQGVCYLTRVTGSFAGAGEAVRITRGSNGYWYLGGSSFQNGVAARARCVHFTDFRNVAYGWQRDPATAYASRGYTRAWAGAIGEICPLTGMSGQFSWGGGEWVAAEPYSPWGEYRASANAGSGTGTYGTAHCSGLLYASGAQRPVNYGGRFYAAAPLDGITVDSAPVRMIPTSQGVCYLARLGGRFSGGGEYAEITQAGGYWWLHAESYRWNAGVHAEAQCVNFE